MKKWLFMVTLFLFLIAEIHAKAEMKITPDGVSSPNNSAEIHLSGSVTTESDQTLAEGAVISGVNNFAGTGALYYTLGGYFQTDAEFGTGVWCKVNGTYGIGLWGESNGNIGRGVGGLASGTAGKAVSGKATNNGNVKNYGGYFETYGMRGIGVYGYANNSGNGENYGGYFKADGTAGKAVYGEAAYFGSVTNYGGYFVARGNSGQAVVGIGTNSGEGTNYGGYFEARGTSGHAVHGKAEGSSGQAIVGIATNTGNVMNYGGYFWANGKRGRGVLGSAIFAEGIGVYGSGGLYDFYAGGSGKTNYGPFTGAHEVKFAGDMPEEITPGMIVSTTGKTETRKDECGGISLSSTLPTVTLSTKPNDKAVFGVIVSDGPLPKDHWYESQQGENFGVVNALGEGRVWVTNRNGNIENGDYVTTSEIPGYGMLQHDDLLHSYTLGKAIETVDWDQVTEMVEHDGESCKRYLIAIVYKSG